MNVTNHPDQQTTPQPDAGRADMRIVLDEPDLRISHYQGVTDMAVVAFTGIGHGMGAIQQDEFIGSALGEDRNHVISVIDKDRSWYSAPGMQERIVATLRALKAELGVRRVVCLGNSMGGFGALLFAERIGADTAIGFVPQYTMRNDFGERRWANFREKMVNDNLDTLGPHLNGRTRAYAVFGAEDLRDRLHVQRIKTNCIARIHLVAGSDHNDLTGFLKREGLLAPLIVAMIAHDDREVARLLASYTVNPGLGPT
ncbi:alpha/beta hydrolase [Marinibacterium profundimaris]|uniref:AB hydrolase-1 domain-containing protein n=1 Tax=Marinibacterium profundimaris TaxID=1679460 RepID=A0A225NS99_9RHOB|nr:alpha/beta hydrolase [Marinibacterium profundimaris]OWU75698.1 hypothetical protein ATO3_05680 [Marinibacterium profundimaris]